MFDRPVRITLAQSLIALAGDIMGPHNPQDLFALTAHFIWGFQERYQQTVASKSASGLARLVHSRLTPAQRAAVADVCESEYRIVSSLKFATLADRLVYRASILKECLTCVAKLIMHWYSEERLPPHRTNQSLTVNPQIRDVNEVGYSFDYKQLRAKSRDVHDAVLLLETMWSNDSGRFIPTSPQPILRTPSLELLKASDTQGKRLNESIQRWRAQIEETTVWQEQDIVWPDSPKSGPIEIIGWTKPEDAAVEVWAAHTLASMATAQCARRH